MLFKMKRRKYVTNKELNTMVNKILNYFEALRIAEVLDHDKRVGDFNIYGNLISVQFKHAEDVCEYVLYRDRLYRVLPKYDVKDTSLIFRVDKVLIPGGDYYE